MYSSLFHLICFANFSVLIQYRPAHKKHYFGLRLKTLSRATACGVLLIPLFLILTRRKFHNKKRIFYFLDIWGGFTRQCRSSLLYQCRFTDEICCTIKRTTCHTISTLKHAKFAPSTLRRVCLYPAICRRGMNQAEYCRHWGPVPSPTGLLENYSTVYPHRL